ncbi:uncharacterized protein BDFB_001124 [Asbolus verrucosus]|uniref:Uncharacterized protein n=1 Tax=Asbolus verrucosus TaxID=1661398 RepID=A0A482W392_ASBVE|nr:uncharacterized protein BDFB_001124 [Asbolus verrucosus]
MPNTTVNFDEFQYVVERKPPDPCCFGSKVPRDTNPIGRGLSPFQKMEAPELFPLVGPGNYDKTNATGALHRLLNKVRSNKGAGPLCSDEPRFKENFFLRTPSPTRYNLGQTYRPKRQQKAPFGSNVRRVVSKEETIPGPGTYVREVRKCRRTRFLYNFGHPTMIPTIEIICVSRPTDVCIKCNQICDGDYWHKDRTTYLCHLCWEEEKRGRELYGEKELKTFKVSVLKPFWFNLVTATF